MLCKHLLCVQGPNVFRLVLPLSKYWLLCTLFHGRSLKCCPLITLNHGTYLVSCHREFAHCCTNSRVQDLPSTGWVGDRIPDLLVQSPNHSATWGLHELWHLDDLSPAIINQGINVSQPSSLSVAILVYNLSTNVYKYEQTHQSNMAWWSNIPITKTPKESYLIKCSCISIGENSTKYQW